MIYKIVDLANNSVAAVCDGKRAVLTASAMNSMKKLWLRTDYMTGKTVFCFDDLNVTGNDIRLGVAEVKYHPVIGAYNVIGKIRRRFQVLDQDGRSVDIRAWKQEIIDISLFGPDDHGNAKRYSNHPLFRQEPCGWGSKNLIHRMNAPAMLHRTLSDAARSGEALTDIETDAFPVIDHTSVRKRGCGKRGWNCYDQKWARKMNSNRSWKDQWKTPRQWSKHKKNVKTNGLRAMRKWQDDGPDEKMPFEATPLLDGSDTDCVKLSA